MAKAKSKRAQEAGAKKEVGSITPTRFGSHEEMIDHGATEIYRSNGGTAKEIVLRDDEGLYVTSLDRVLRKGVKDGVADPNRYANSKARIGEQKPLEVEVEKLAPSNNAVVEKLAPSNNAVAT